MKKTNSNILAKIDADPSMHYYVYFSSANYKYALDVMKFNDISELKASCYKNYTFYDTYAEAEAAANEMNANDTDIRHIICRKIVENMDSVAELVNANSTKLTKLELDSIKLISDMQIATLLLFDATEEVKN